MEAKPIVYDRPVTDGAEVPEATRSERREPTERIDPRAVRAWRVSGAAAAGLVLLIMGALSALLWRLDVALWVTAIPIALAAINAVVAVWIAPTVLWRQWRYAVSERDVELKRGIVIITHTLIPMARVQHVNTTQGPVLRHYGLATVIIATAAGAQEIPALSLDVAEALRDRIAALAGVADDV